MGTGVRIRLVLLTAILVCVGASSFGEVTLASLVLEMTDLEKLAEFPEPSFTCKQFSSYDRRSTDPSVLTDENWFANGDRGHHLRVEERNGAKEWVLMDAEGPGAIVRFWSANPKDAETVRIYLDGAADPVIEMPLTELLGGSAAMPFIAPICGQRSRGWNCYLPIPYGRHCKVTASAPNFYYQVNYRTYEVGTKVETYTSDVAARNAQLIERTATQLTHPASAPLPAGCVRRPLDFSLAPNTLKTVPLLGSGAIRRIALRVNAEDLETALRRAVIRIEFDIEEIPSVEAPLGDFFGMAPGLNPYEALPCGVLSDGTLYSHWVMPYKKRAKLSFANFGDEPLDLKGAVFTLAERWTRKSMHFHAKWHMEYPLPTRPRVDWTYVEAEGKGRFVGDMLHISNPVKDWWGEGDEKIYVDGETFPSTFGTGTEDYYGYAWCCNEPFVHAYHNQPRCDGPGNYGQTSVNRFHIIDSIPFDKSFKFDMEAWHWADCEIAMAAISYWYAKPGGTDSFERLQPADLRLFTPPPPPEPPRVEGALEGEEMALKSVTGGEVTVQESEAWGWSAGKQAWWTKGTPGDVLTAAFKAPKAGKYEVLAVFTKAVDYGIAQVAINGVNAGDPIDFFNNGVIATPQMSLGTFDLKEGENELKATITGANDKAEKAYMFGLDYILLKPAE